MSELIERLKARWVADGLSLRPGASPEALDAFEAKYRVALPSLVRGYFEAVDGTGDDSDNVLIRFWTLDELMPIEEYDGSGPGEAAGFEGWFYFADFMICSHNFAVRLSPDPADGGPVMYAAGSLHPLAPSFDAFLRCYLTDRERLRCLLPPVGGRSSGRDDGSAPAG